MQYSHICNLEAYQIQKMKWIGGMLRKQTDNISRNALEWNPQRSKGRSRPKIIWYDTVRLEPVTWSKIVCEINERVGNAF